LLKSKLSAAAFVRKSRLIVGLDLTADTPQLIEGRLSATKDELETRARNIIQQTSDSVVAYKFNRQIVLPLGLFEGTRRLIESIHEEGLLAIMDCKINDIGNTNGWITRYYLDAGFDAVIVNPLVGWEGGLDTVFKLVRERKRAVITLCYMSHPAADEGYGLSVVMDEKKKKHEPLYMTFARRAVSWDADAVIVGATYPDRIREVRSMLGEDIPILSPGVGAQGGSAREAIDAGASYVIAARSVCNAENPGSAARELADQTY
jgi:orotidine-5'-phosphate decarboxylase